MTMSVCATCASLRVRGKASKDDEERDGNRSVRLVDTTLAQLRGSSGSCRACAVLLNGVLFYHSRFAAVKEDETKITADVFPSKALQDHLTVNVRWTSHEEESDDMEEHEHEEDYPDLKLEFFTDESKSSQPLPLRQPSKRGLRSGSPRCATSFR